MTRLLALAILLLSLGLPGCGGEDVTPSAQAPVSPILASGRIGPAGGTVSVAEGPFAGASVTIPAGALQTEELITIAPGTELSEPGFIVWGPALEFGPPGTQFALPVQISLPVPPLEGLISDYLTAHRDEVDQTLIQPLAAAEGQTVLEVETFNFSTFQGLRHQVEAPRPTLTPRPSLSPNAPLSTGTTTGQPPLIAPLSADTFLTSITFPEGPATALHPDGTLVSNPVVDRGMLIFDRLVYDLRSLSQGDSIRIGTEKSHFSEVVYSMVPVLATTDYAYGHLKEYYLDDSKNTVHPDPMPVTRRPGTINDGARSSIGPSPTASSYDANTPVYLASNNAKDNLHYFFPNLPNGRDASGYTDHLGLTENVCWTFNPFLYTFRNRTYDTGLFWRFCHGWASPSENANQTVQWNKMDDTNLNQANPGGAAPLQLSANSGGDLVSATILALKGKTAAELATLFSGWVNTNANQNNPNWTSVQQLPSWLASGAFVTYQPMPGFQCNLLRQNTPAGTYTMAENTSMLFVRNTGQVEIPAASNGTSVTGSVPLVLQTWTDQRFVLYNALTEVVPSTQDQYPGEEYYYLGNTYLPRRAGVVNRWTHYPRMTLVSATGQPQPDERDTDCWLGLRGDQPWDVMAWMTGYVRPPGIHPQPNDLGYMELGGQARKPFMLGASQQLKTSTGATVLETLRLENSNSFWWVQVPKKDSSLKGMYAATLCVDPDGKGNLGYLPVAKIWWKWVPQSFDLSSGVYTWSAKKSELGSWVPQFQWLVRNGPEQKDKTTGVLQYPARGFPAGWFNQLPGPTGSANQGTSDSPNVFTLAGPAPGKANTGSSISLTVNEAVLPASAAPQAIAWSPPASGPFSPGQARTTNQRANSLTSNRIGDTVQRYTIEAVTPLASDAPNFLIQLGPAPTN